MITSLELNQKPAILIYLTEAPQDLYLEEVLLGIEEEGIPFQLEHVATENVVKAAYEAAGRSDLAVGIGCDGERIVVHYRNLPVEQPLFNVERYQLKMKQTLRSLGSNAARLVKRTAFKELSEMGE